jgi:hypothetical protein
VGGAGGTSRGACINPQRVARAAASYATTRQHEEVIRRARVPMPGSQFSDHMEDEPAVFAADARGSVGNLLNTDVHPNGLPPARPQAANWARARDEHGVFQNQPQPGVEPVMQAVRRNRQRFRVAEEVQAAAQQAGL